MVGRVFVSHRPDMETPTASRAGGRLVVGGLTLTVGVAMLIRPTALAWTLMGAALVLPAGILVAVAPLRQEVVRRLRRLRYDGPWTEATGAAGLLGVDGRSPRLCSVDRVPVGDALVVSMPAGLAVSHLADASELLAGHLEVRDVRVARDPENARRAVVTVVRRDPLATAAELVWPTADARTTSLWEPVPVAVDESGAPVHLSLAGRNLLLGGEPGAGKSNAMSLLVAAGALDPTVRLVLLDGKLVELAPWAPCAAMTAGPDLGRALDVVREVQGEMDARYSRLLEQGRRKVEPGDGLPLHLVVIDELAFYLSGVEDRKARTEFAERLRDLVSRGRAAGVVVIAATQKPSADIVPTFLRDLFGFRWALRCSTPQASDTVLGSGWATQGYTTSTVDAAHRGVGLLLAEGGTPRRCKAYLLADDAVAGIAARAARTRSAGGQP